MKKYGVWLLIALFVGLGGWWLFKEATKPLPGEKIADMGANHLTDIAEVTYNSNPPTSGPHFPIWAKRGLYDRVLSDGYLIHSLEHGYVIISYNCTKLNSNIKSQNSKLQFKIQNLLTVYAHEGEPVEGSATPSASIKPLMHMSGSGMSFFTPDNPPAVEVELPESFKSEECKKLAKDLWDLGDDFERVIVVPRVDQDAPIALTAWGRIEKLTSFDKEKIKAFIAAFHNKGPEKTQE